MGKRKKKQGPEELLLGLVGLPVLYLVVTGHGSILFRLLPVLVAFLAVVGLGVVVLRRRKTLPPVPDGNSSGRRAPTVAFPSVSPNPMPDVLDRVREMSAQSKAVEAEARPTTWSLQLIRDLEWKRFEELCEGFWKAKGYRAELTGRGADGGIDINLYRPSAPDKLLAIIQCKSRSQDRVGVQIVRELFGVMNHVNAPMGILVTSSDFHEPAKDFAAGKRLQLVNGATLFKQLAELPTDASASLLAHVTRDDYITPTCPSCDVKMVLRPGTKGKADFYGCTNYPKCRTVMHVRSTKA